MFPWNVDFHLTNVKKNIQKYLKILTSNESFIDGIGILPYSHSSKSFESNLHKSTTSFWSIIFREIVIDFIPLFPAWKYIYFKNNRTLLFFPNFFYGKVLTSIRELYNLSFIILIIVGKKWKNSAKNNQFGQRLKLYIYNLT